MELGDDGCELLATNGSANGGSAGDAKGGLDGTFMFEDGEDTDDVMEREVEKGGVM